jgi:hypothetical protein
MWNSPLRSMRPTAGQYWILCATVMVAMAGLPSLAYAEKQKDIEAKGFKCETSGVDSVVCSKQGEKDYICDKAGTCAQMRPKPPGGARINQTPTRERAR